MLESSKVNLFKANQLFNQLGPTWAYSNLKLRPTWNAFYDSWSTWLADKWRCFDRVFSGNRREQHDHLVRNEDELLAPILHVVQLCQRHRRPVTNGRLKTIERDASVWKICQIILILVFSLWTCSYLEVFSLDVSLFRRISPNKRFGECYFISWLSFVSFPAFWARAFAGIF